MTANLLLLLVFTYYFSFLCGKEPGEENEVITRHLRAGITTSPPQVQCLLHPSNTTSSNRNIKSSDLFLVLIDNDGGGLGNYLVFFPTAFYFSAFTGRRLILLDGTPLAELCRFLNCNVPLLSEVRTSSPALDQLYTDYQHAIQQQSHVSTLKQSSILTTSASKSVVTASVSSPDPSRTRTHPSAIPGTSRISSQVVAKTNENLQESIQRKYPAYRIPDLTSHITGSRLIDDSVVLLDGYRRISNWFADSTDAVSCIEQLTTCVKHDIECREGFSLVHAFPGPFSPGSTIDPSVSPTIASYFRGFSHQEIQDILHHQPSKTKKAVIDVGVHLRCQFQHFEQSNSESTYKNRDSAEKSTDKTKTLQEFLGSFLYPLLHAAANQSDALTRMCSSSSSKAHSPFGSEGEAVIASIVQQLSRKIGQGSPPSSSSPSPSTTRLFVTSDDLSVKRLFLRIVSHCFAAEIESNRLLLSYVEYPPDTDIAHSRTRTHSPLPATQHKPVRATAPTAEQPPSATTQQQQANVHDMLVALDWFLLAQSQGEIWAWRRQHSFTSTFALSAYMYSTALSPLPSSTSSASVETTSARAKRVTGRKLLVVSHHRRHRDQQVVDAATTKPAVFQARWVGLV